ncbi:9171_t:CDS:2, partial [Cetraspora pellucida]
MKGEREISKASFKYKISVDTLRSQKSYYSPPFATSENMFWQLKFDLECQENLGYCSLWLVALANPQENVSTDIWSDRSEYSATCFMKNPYKEMNFGKLENYNIRSCLYGFAKFIERNKLPKEGEVTIGVRFNKIIFSSERSTQIFPSPEFPPELIKVWKSECNKSTISDVQFNFPNHDNKCVYARSTILTERSEYFKAMLQRGVWNESHISESDDDARTNDVKIPIERTSEKISERREKLSTFGKLSDAYKSFRSKRYRKKKDYAAKMDISSQEIPTSIISTSIMEESPITSFVQITNLNTSSTSLPQETNNVTTNMPSSNDAIDAPATDDKFNASQKTNIIPLPTLELPQTPLTPISSQFTAPHSSTTTLPSFPPIETKPFTDKIVKKYIITIPDVHPETYKYFLRYLYTNDIKFYSSPAYHRTPWDFFKIADKYLVNELRDLAKARILRELTPNNAIDMFFGIDLLWEDMKELLLNYLVRKWESVK